MKKLILRLLILNFILSAFSCSTTGLERKGLQETSKDNKVNSRIEEEKKESQWILETVNEYFLSQETVRYADGFIDGYILYEYDEKAQLIKKERVSAENLPISAEFNYYSDDKLEKTILSISNEKISTTEFYYNEQGLKQQEVFLNKLDEVTGSSSFEYDKEGRLIKWISSDLSGIPLLYVQYEYEGTSSLKRRACFYLPSGELEGCTEFHYKDGLLIEELSYSALNQFEKKYVYSYNAKNQLIKEEFYTGTKPYRTVLNSYDENGNLVLVKNLNRNNKVIDMLEKEYVMFSVDKMVLR